MPTKLTYEAVAAASRPEPRGWWHRLSDDDKKTLLEVRSRWQENHAAGTAPPAFSFARGLIAACEGTSIRLPAKKALAEWIKQTT